MKNTLILIGGLLCMSFDTSSQIGIGINAGYSRAFNEVISESNKNNVIVGLKFEYYNSSIFQPMLDVDFSMIALDRSWIAQNSYEGVFNLRYNLFNFGLSTLIRVSQNETSESGIVPGFGISSFRKSRMIFDGTYNGTATNRGPLMTTDYAATELNPFVSLSYLGQKEIYKNLAIQVQVGALYYVRNESVIASYQYNDDFNNSYVLDVNDKVKALRPFFKVSAIWTFGKKDALQE